MARGSLDLAKAGTVVFANDAERDLVALVRSPGRVRGAPVVPVTRS
ncbi:MAG: hypothetical protein IPO93_00025 [Actinobacteria bacterium]|jgi:hypothetical protein|nr:hypothetical protein [Actinomycetota bacterium]